MAAPVLLRLPLDIDVSRISIGLLAIVDRLLGNPHPMTHVHPDADRATGMQWIEQIHARVDAARHDVTLRARGESELEDMIRFFSDFRVVHMTSYYDREALLTFSVALLLLRRFARSSCAGVDAWWSDMMRRAARRKMMGSGAPRLMQIALEWSLVVLANVHVCYRETYGFDHIKCPYLVHAERLWSELDDYLLALAADTTDS